MSKSRDFGCCINVFNKIFSYICFLFIAVHFLLYLNSGIIPCIFNPFRFVSQVQHFVGVASGSHCFVYFQRTDKEKAIYLVLRALRYLTKPV